MWFGECEGKADQLLVAVSQNSAKSYGCTKVSTRMERRGEIQVIMTKLSDTEACIPQSMELQRVRNNLDNDWTTQNNLNRSFHICTITKEVC